MSAVERIAHVAGRLWRVPCKLMLATMALCLGVREWYPFSPFTMYATFSPTTWHVCVTDAADQVLPTERYFGRAARPLRRMFETRVLEQMANGVPRAAAEASAARELLRFALREARPRLGSPALPERITLRRTVTRIDGPHLERSNETLGVLDE